MKSLLTTYLTVYHTFIHVYNDDETHRSGGTAA